MKMKPQKLRSHTKNVTFVLMRRQSHTGKSDAVSSSPGKGEGRHRLGFGSELKALFRLGLPILLTQLGLITVNFADTIMVGSYGTPELAAAAFVNNIFMVPMVMMIGFAGGTTPLVGALYGADNRLEIGRVLKGAVQLNALLALFFMVVMGTLYLLLGNMGQPPELLPLIRRYYLIIYSTLLPAALFNAFQQTANGMTDTAMPMTIVLSANALNILGNYLLIEGHWGLPELGLAGAGLSTAIARYVSLAGIVLFVLFSRRYAPCRQGWRQGRADHALRRKIAITSVPVMIQNGSEVMVWSFGAVVCGWYDSLQLAAYQITNTMSNLGFMMYLSFSIAVSIRVANKTGLRDISGMRLTARAGVMLNLCLSVLASMVFIFFSRALLHIFTPDEAVVRVALLLIAPLVLYQVFDALQVTLSNVVRGTSHVLPLLWTAIFCFLVAGVPVIWLLGWKAGLGSQGVYYSFSVVLLMACTLYYVFYRRTLRRLERQWSTPE